MTYGENTIGHSILNIDVEIKKGYTRTYEPNYLDSLIAACAAARRAIGTRKGEHDT